MKKIFLLFSILISFKAMSQDQNREFDALWSELENFERSALYKSAYEVAERIYDLAIAQEREDQLIKALIYKAKLSRLFEDKDPAEIILKWVSQVNDISSDAGKAIFQSMLGELFHQYAMTNLYRFSERTPEVSDSLFLAYGSLESIQRTSIDYYLTSMDYSGPSELTEFASLFSDEELRDLDLKASNVREFLVFRALDHFMNTNSFVSIPKGRFVMKDEDLFGTDKIFTNINFDVFDQSDYRVITLAIFKKLAKDESLSLEQKELIGIKRLEYVYNQYELNAKDGIYKKSLENLISSLTQQRAKELAYIKLIEFHLRKAENKNVESKEDNQFMEAFRWIQKYKASFGDGLLSKTVDQQRQRLNAFYLNVESEKVVFKGEEFLAYARYRNTASLYVSLFKISERRYEEFLNSRNYEDKLAMLEGMSTLHQWQIEMPKYQDFDYHSIEFPIPKLDYGIYILCTTSDSMIRYDEIHPVVLNPIIVSDLSYTIENNSEGIKGRVLNKKNGIPISSVDVEFFDFRYNYQKGVREKISLGKTLSDKDGTFYYSGSSHSVGIKLKHNNDELFLTDSHYFYNHQDNRATLNAAVFTDRSIYRPGQNIFFKILLYSLNQRNSLPEKLDQTNVQVILRDVNWQIVDERKLKSNEFGSLESVFDIPSSGLNGTYTIEISIPGNTIHHSVQVEEYKRPKIKAEFDKISNSFKLGDTISLEVLASSYIGIPLSNAQVEYTIVARTWIQPYYRRSIMPPHIPDQIIDFGSGVTGDDGKFSFNIPTENKEGVMSLSYQVECVITDQTGESTIISKTINVSNEHYTIRLDLPEQFFANELDSVYLSSTNNEGEEMDVQYNFQIFEYKDNSQFKRSKLWSFPDQFLLTENEYSSRFPWDAREANSGRTKNLGKECKSFSVSGKGLWLDQFKSLKEGEYKLIVNTVDKQGHTKTLVRDFQISGSKNKAPATKALWISSLDDSYEVGKGFELKVNSPFENFQVFYLLSQNGIELMNGQLNRKNNKLNFDIEEKHRGGLQLQLFMIHEGRHYHESFTINVPWTNKELKLELTNFRDHTLPGSEETFEINITRQGHPWPDAEVSAVLYDSSLDVFVKHDWVKTFYPTYHSHHYINFHGFGKASNLYFKKGRPIFYDTNVGRLLPTLQWFGYERYISGGNMYRNMEMDGVMFKRSAVMDAEGSAEMMQPTAVEEVAEEEVISEDQASTIGTDIRENLNELVFFYPQLRPNKEGKVDVSFKMNDAITSWRLMVFSHDKELRTGYVERIIKTSKPLMVEPFLPRFVMQGDSIILTARVTNTSDALAGAKVSVQINDAKTGSDISHNFIEADEVMQTIELLPGASMTVKWKTAIPLDQIQALDITISASSDDYTDAEKSRIPVLSRKVFVSESLPLYSNPGQTIDFDFKALDKISQSQTLNSYQYVLDYQTDPNWIVLKALPYLLEDNPSSTLQLFDSYYATLVGIELVNSSDYIKQKLLDWKNSDSASLEYSLLGSDGIESSPWLRDALSEADNMKKLHFLLDENKVNYKIGEWDRMLRERQNGDGGLSWMPGGHSNWYITQAVLEGISRLKLMDIDHVKLYENNFVRKMIDYVDKEFAEYHRKNNVDNTTMNPMVVHYIFVRSMYSGFPQDEEISLAMMKYVDRYKSLWMSSNSYLQSLFGISLLNMKDNTANDIRKSLSERLIRDEEMGFYLNDQAGYYWYQLDVEKQSTLISFYEMFEGQEDIVNGLKRWLLKNKQLNSWKTSKATSSAVYSFYNSFNTQWEGSISINFPESSIEFHSEKAENIHQQWDEPSTIVHLRKAKIQNESNRTSWGSLTWQYFEDIDEIKTFKESGLKIEKRLYKLGFGDQGEYMVPITEEALSVGDKLRVKIHISSDRPMEFVSLEDMRGSGLEPLQSISEYQWRDGLSYYSTVKDDSNRFYIEYLPKGRFVFQHDLIVTHSGKYSGGMATIKSMYAPEFTSHSNTETVSIEN